MSRKLVAVNMLLDRFPRVSGDEPTVTVGKQVKEGFSPRERG